MAIFPHLEDLANLLLANSPAFSQGAPPRCSRRLPRFSAKRDCVRARGRQGALIDGRFPFGS